jgi:hypothetical protein
MYHRTGVLKFYELDWMKGCKLRMSGLKKATVTLSENEYRKLHDGQMRLRFLERKMPDMLEEAQEAGNALLWENISLLRDRQQDYQELVNGFDEQVRDLESETAESLAAYQENFYTSLQNVAGDLLEHTSQALAEQNQLFIDLYTQENNFRQEQLSHLEQQITNLQGSTRQKRAYAIQWIEAARKLAGFIQARYDSNMFAPGQIGKLSKDLQLSMQNLNQGMPEAALLNAQQTFSRLTELRGELERKYNEWTVLYQASQITARRFYTLLAASQRLPALDTDGNELPYEIDIDFWCGRKLSRLAEKTRNVLQQLEKDKAILDAAALNQLIQNDFPAFQDEFDRLIVDARLAALNSQVRINIADLVVQALEQQGFALQESKYSNNDQRKAFSARVQNLEGSEVIIQVMPVPGDAGKNELQLHSLDKDQRTEHELRQRSSEITRTLNDYGLVVGALTAENTGQAAAENEKTAPIESEPLTIHKRTPGVRYGNRTY